MIKITKKEAMWLLNNGYKFKEHIHKTYTSHPTYYVTEGKPYNELKRYNNSLIGLTKEGK